MVLALGLFHKVRSVLVVLLTFQVPESRAFLVQDRVVRSVVLVGHGKIFSVNVCGYQGADRGPETLARAFSLVRAELAGRSAFDYYW